MPATAKITLKKALRLTETAPPSIAFVGAGGKSSAMFQLAQEIAPCIVTTSTHLGIWQAEQAEKHITLHATTDFKKLAGTPSFGVTLATGKEKNKRLQSLSPENLARLQEFATRHSLPLLIEADGARKKPVKAPKPDEPVIPDFTDLVVVVAGLSGIGEKLSKKKVYNAERFAALGKMKEGEKISLENLTRVLTHKEGGQKNIPTKARKIVLLNQADTIKQQAIGEKTIENLLKIFETVIVAALQKSQLRVFQRTSAIILAAGSSSRFGEAKQLLDFHGTPFVRVVAEKAMQAGLSKIVVVTGAEDAEIRQVLAGLPVKIVYNPSWEEGQSASIRAGIEHLPPEIGSAIFLLADQPQVTSTVMRALIEEHRRTLNPIIAPMVEGRRATPVLFDRVTFSALQALRGDVGGRGIFAKFSPSYMHWQDSALLLDVDSREDYVRLLEITKGRAET